MTREEFDNIKWVGHSHLAMSTGHETIYKSDTPFFTIYKSVYVYFRNGVPTKRKSVTYIFNDKYFSDSNKLIEYLNKK